MKRQCDCRLVFGFQPFYHYAKSVGTCREIKAINRTEYLQANTEWNKVKKRILDCIGDTSLFFEELCEEFEFEYIDFNKYFDLNEDLFVDSVHLTDLGNRRITEVFNELLEKN